jgi:hypothetical protein
MAASIPTDIIPTITTPLALAALALLVISGILKLVVPKAKQEDLRLLINWSFGIAIILGILADISFLVIASFSREVRIAGLVDDDQGNPLGMAVVEIPGCGRGITDDYGSFEFSIPDSRANRNSYEVITHLEGYKSDTQTLQGPRPNKYLTIKLQHPVLTADALIQTPTQCGIGHYLGRPEVGIWLAFYNPLPHTIAISDVSLSVVDPHGKLIHLQMQGTYQPPANQLVLQPLAPFQLTKGQSFAIGYSFFDQYALQTALVLLQEAQSQFPGTSMPYAGQVIYSDELVKKLTDFMNQQWFWEAGDWQIIMGCKAEGLDYSRTFKFSVADGDIERMKAISRYYKSGYGILSALRYANLPDAASYVTANVLDQQ